MNISDHKNQNYKIIKQSGRSKKVKIKKSTFIGSVYKIYSISEKDNIISKNNSEMKKASHNAWAIRILTENGIWEDFSDDGEVPGCAGKPILYILQKINIINILVIVTRYYGGVHLGPSGLIKAYSSTAKDLIEVISFN